MQIPDIKDLVRDGKLVRFTRFQRSERGAELWYRHQDGFEFPVPVEDTGDAAFLAEDKAIVFMRWIRPHLKFVRDSFGAQADE